MAPRAQAAALDAGDALGWLRARFLLPDGVIYLDGNSLGALPRAAPARLAETVAREWGDRLVRGWNECGWWEMPRRLGDRLGAMLGAAPGQVVVCDTVSINLFKVLRAALGLRPERDTVLAEAASFPTDLYMIEGALAPGQRLRLIGADGDVPSLLDDRVAAVLLSHVDYRSGALLPMAELSAGIAGAGALCIWDVSHSAGVVPIALDADGVDFAVGCTYKYLNAGPGAPGFVYAAQRHLPAARQPLSGWWGHAAPFAFEQAFRPAEGIARFLTGTQPILSMRAVECALDALEGADPPALRRKSQALTTLFMECVAPLGLPLLTPADPDRRGSQVALTHPEAYRLMQALIARGVIGDVRAPDVLRFGFAPAYLRFVDVVDAAEVLADCLHHEAWRDVAPTRAAVT